MYIYIFYIYKYLIIMCIICKTHNYKKLKDVKKIYCCPEVREIPSSLINLRKLFCSDCPLLTSIPDTLVNLTKLHCYRSALISSIPTTLVNLEELRCWDCPLITTIPNTLVQLKILDCTNCTLLTSIPNTLVQLTQLHCYSCSLLTSIPTSLLDLRDITCDDCPLLYIPIKYRTLIDVKSSSNGLRIRILQRRIRKKYYSSLIHQSSLYIINSVVLQYM
jgi:hypothetical protein